MRILRLELEGFGPYLDRQEIDLTAFETEGLFAITGRTGAGKSTILDAICFALYDKVPRYEKAEPVLRSHFCGEDDPTSVAVDYEVGARQYRVWRSPAYERAKKRGTGTTTKGAEAKLYVRRGAEWEILAAMPREVGEHVSATVPLTGEQFLQVILLAQGRFAEFLKADTSERRTVLRSLFGTRRFEDLEQHIREIAKTRQAAVDAADGQLAGLVERAAVLVGVDAPTVAERDPFWQDAAASTARAVDAATAARGDATTAAEATAAALNEAREVERARDRLSRARVTVADLEARADEQAAREARVASARRAVPVLGPMREAERAERASAEASDALERAREVAAADPAAGLAWPAGDLTDAGEAGLRERESELAGEIGALSGALAAERSIPSLEATHARKTEAAAAAADAVEATRAALDALPEREQELREALEAAGTQAARVEDLAGAVERARTTVEAHGLVDRLSTTLDRAHASEAGAAETHAAAATAHAALVQRRLRSQAAHLASELEDGAPCPVCGATDHPSPARPSDDHVTNEAVDAAYEALQAADRALAGARDARAEADRALAAAREKAGEGDAEAAAATLETARTEHAAALAAASERDRLTRELETLATREAALVTRREEQTRTVATAQEAVTRAATELASARDLAAHRPDGYATVAAYADALASARSLLARLIAATGTADDAAAAHAKATAALDEALASSGLAGIEEARGAGLEPAALTRLEAEAESYRSDLAAAHAVVAELSDRELPEEAADLEALAAAATEAAGARDAAIEAATAAAGRARDLDALATEYRELGESTASARAERDVVATLADALEGKAPNERRLRLESFVLASKLERIMAAANVRLRTMSSGQYQLEHDDSAQYRGKETGLALRIADAHTGQARSTRSLSGGETFLASLALALGLAETVTAEAGGIELSTLFIDEGFGSLDGDTLEVAMSTLNDLRDSGRTVGLISHVEAMHDAIPARLEVTKAADGSSRVEVKVGEVD
ncbi:SMC family ATPase [Demequina sp. SYSU T00192]|uniref:Nuclease SbcCD subunit C n=1 Tax=Demequina litoralis TaxID=3051660 RepID=A0ABT8G9F8_9MICO|nr:SMC family ATPase [Demequina sp. SYSU T00192]MDN4475780.1 SMC family ATPase [Demequina sp. SYSU T00192]